MIFERNDHRTGDWSVVFRDFGVNGCFFFRRGLRIAGLKIDGKLLERSDSLMIAEKYGRRSRCAENAHLELLPYTWFCFVKHFLLYFFQNTDRHLSYIFLMPHRHEEHFTSAVTRSTTTPTIIWYCIFLMLIVSKWVHLWTLHCIIPKSMRTQAYILYNLENDDCLLSWTVCPSAKGCFLKLLLGYACELNIVIKLTHFFLLRRNYLAQFSVPLKINQSNI